MGSNSLQNLILQCEAYAQRSGLAVFYYHGIVENRRDHRLERNLCLLETFRSQVNVFKRLRVLPLTEFLAELTKPSGETRPGVVITFDDGYANNWLAAEILSAARLPWTVFISTGAMGRLNTIWTVELSLLLLHGRVKSVEVLGRKWDLTSRQSREAAFQAIRLPLKRLPSNLRREAMDDIRHQFPQGETQFLLQAFPSLQMMTWEEIKQLADAGVEIGSHGVHHEIHHHDQPEAVRRYELRASKAEIENRLNGPCRFFAFPNGNYNASSASEAQEAGYELAFTAKPGMAAPGVNPYLVPRLSF